MSLIQQLKEGKIAIKINPGITLTEDLNRVLLSAGNGNHVNGLYQYYWLKPGHDFIERKDDTCPIPYYPISDFIAELNQTQQSMSDKIITSKQAQQIIDIACSTWKARLANQWSLNIVLSKDIVIPADEYSTMRAACTAGQHALFDTIFGPQYEVGTHVITKGYSRDYDGRVLKITRISQGKYVFFEVLDGGYWKEDNNFGILQIERLATPDEIKNTKPYPPKGTWCLVKDHADGSWCVRIYNGEGGFATDETYEYKDLWDLFIPIEQTMLDKMKASSPDMFE